MRFIIVLVFVFHLAWPCLSSSAAEFNAPLQLGKEYEGIKEASLLVDQFNFPSVAYTAGRNVLYSHGYDGFLSSITIPGLEEPFSIQDIPSLDKDAAGRIYLVFRETGRSSSARIAWSVFSQGQFAVPVPVSNESCGLCSDTFVFPQSSGDLLLGWSIQSTIDPQSGELYLAMNQEDPEQVLQGVDFFLKRDSEEVLHAAYIKSGDLYYSNSAGDGLAANEIRLVSSSGASLMAPEIEFGRNNRPFIFYLFDYTDIKVVGVLSNGSPSASELLVDSIEVPRLFSVAVDADRNFYSLVYIKHGALQLQTNILGFGFGENVSPVCEATGAETSVQIEQDGNKNNHILVIRAGALYYMNNAPSPQADFTASVVSGEFPLSVEFIDQSSGFIHQYEWDFGDGATSVKRHPGHSYETPGLYTVTLRVKGLAGAFSEEVKEDYILVTPKKNHLYCPDMIVYAGQENLKVPIRFSNKSLVEGFQLVGRYNTDTMSFAAEITPQGNLGNFVDLENTSTDVLDPEFVASICFPERRLFKVGVIFEISEPFEDKSLLPGDERELINLVVNVNPDVENRTDLGLKLENIEIDGEQIERNFFTVNGGFTTLPAIHNGRIVVVRADEEELGDKFIRGDTDNDRSIMISDSIVLLSYLFGASGVQLPCQDAADANDDGSLNISDPIMLLNYQFGNGPSPVMPFPYLGFDPTEDSLRLCDWE